MMIDQACSSRLAREEDALDPPPWRQLSAGCKVMAPVWFVPENRPKPAFCFCRTTPLNDMDLVEPGGTTLPLKAPVAKAIERVNLFSLWFEILLLEVSATELVNGALRLPPLNAAKPLVKSMTRFCTIGFW
jgi:hypothetical protein